MSMAPIEARIDGQLLWMSSKGRSAANLKGLEITYDGDETGRYGISTQTASNNMWLTGGTLRPGEKAPPIEIGKKTVPPVEKGQPPSEIKTFLVIKRTL